ncbi:DUF167 domain-containing protein [Paraconexibacter sp.]|uniref:DUF167 domain-containing protein n=1 Tax=Paraconexibacter sp. TaxID=2949640 RepID=UPI00356205CF
MPDVEVRVRVVPRAARDQLAGTRAGAVLVRLTAPPVDGKANAALRKLVARAVGVPPSAVSIVRGETGRDKTLRIEGVRDAAAALRDLGL